MSITRGLEKSFVGDGLEEDGEEEVGRWSSEDSQVSGTFSGDSFRDEAELNFGSSSATSGVFEGLGEDTTVGLISIVEV